MCDISLYESTYTFMNFVEPWNFSQVTGAAVYYPL